MMLPVNGVRVYLALGATDMRKSIDGLSILVSRQMQLDPFAGHLFGFCNRSRTIIKLLYWDRNGFCLWHKRLERHVFRWPTRAAEVLAIDSRQLIWLLDGLDPLAVKGHSRLEIVHDLPESEKVCPCGAVLVRIGEEVSEKLDIVPAKIQVIRHIRPKYACRACEGVEGDGPTVKTAPMPPQIIPQGIVTPGLLAHVAVAKYADALPLYRQEDQFARLGLDVSRGTLAGWMIRVAKACEPLIAMIIEEIRSGPIVNMDETTVQVMHEPDRANTTKSYMWVARGGTPGTPVVLFRYHPTRAGSVAAEILGNFQGYLQTDGYSGYEALGDREGLCHLGCLAHVRRKFVEVEKAAGKKAKGGTAHAVLDLIGKLYSVEHQAEKQRLDPEQIKALRAEKSRPILDKLKALLDARIATTPPKSLLGRAISYALKQWDRLVVYLEDGRLRPDNNLAENAIRPFAVGRKNWLFSGHPRGADASATLYSLIETAKANDLEPYRYLRHLFEHLPAATSDAQRKALLPPYIAPKSLIIPT